MTGFPPPIDIRRDGHVHTRLCRHATGEMEEYVLAAIDRGLTGMVFLEHLEAGINYFERTWLSEEDFDHYFREGLRLRDRYAGRLEIGLGVEVGYNPAGEEELLSRLTARSWDRVGISCHFLPIDATGRHLNLLSRQPQNIVIAREMGVEHLLTGYLSTLLQAVRALPGTVLCHLDAALRHVPEVAFTEDHFCQIDALLGAVGEKGMALEINTSGIAMGREPFPARRILAMAIEYGIPLEAGSDAHRPEDVGRYFSTLPDYLTSAVSP